LRAVAATIMLSFAVGVGIVCGMCARSSAQDFGSPPSGAYPIIFNDHTVYAKPDTLRRGRVLAALVDGQHVYVPLRSMFEALGAAVTVSADGRTIRAEKSGASVAVTLGRREVVINGETRPLDVPPLRYHGIVLVPVRVISEALGAYVQWVPAERVVVVRTVPLASAPPPPPSPAPPAPTSAPVVPAPSPAPTVAPPAVRPYAFIEGAYSDGTNYDEFISDARCRTYLIDAAYALRNSPLAIKIDDRLDTYVSAHSVTTANGNQYTQFATIDGGVAFTPVFEARQSTLDVRLEYQIASPRIYVGAGYLQSENNYGYPRLEGAGAGIEKLPSLRSGIDVYGSAYYYPSVTGTYTVAEPASVNDGLSYRQRYAIVRYDIGAALVSARFPFYLFGGVRGDRFYAKANAPIGQLHDGPYLGLGVKL